MRKRGEEGNTRAAVNSNGIQVLPFLFGTGLAFILCLILLFGVATGIWASVLPEDSPGMLLPLCVGVCAVIGARRAVKQGRGNALLNGVITGAAFGLCILLIGCMAGGEFLFSGRLTVILLAAIAGGALAGLFGKGKKKKKR